MKHPKPLPLPALTPTVPTGPSIHTAYRPPTPPHSSSTENTPMAPSNSPPELTVVCAPYGTGAHYANELYRQGRRVAAVTRPAELLPSHYRHPLEPGLYERVFYDISPATISALREAGARHVFAGTEIGVEDADALAEALGLPGNRASTSRLRRDKGLMAVAAAEAGLLVPRGLVTGSLNDARRWVQRLGRKYVVKPVDSAGSEGVTICSTPGELDAAWQRLHRVENAMGGANVVLQLQEYLEGEQYAVNSVTISPTDPRGKPRHLITETHRDRRIGDKDSPRPAAGPAHLYDRYDLLPPDAPLTHALTQCVERLLDALDVRHGPVHTELILTADGPVPIDVGCRPMGSYDPISMRDATGTDHVRDAVTAALTGELPHIDRSRIPLLHVSTISLISPTRCTLDERLLRQMLALPTVAGHVGKLEPGRTFEKTVDALTVPGRITMISASQEDIDHDYQTIWKEIEPGGLYRPVVSPHACVR